jgi:hypothetical protein
VVPGPGFFLHASVMFGRGSGEQRAAPDAVSGEGSSRIVRAWRLPTRLCKAGGPSNFVMKWWLLRSRFCL